MAFIQFARTWRQSAVHLDVDVEDSAHIHTLVGVRSGDILLASLSNAVLELQLQKWAPNENISYQLDTRCSKSTLIEE